MGGIRPSVALYDLLDEIGASTGLQTTLSLLDRRLRGLLPFEAMAVFLRGEERLFPAYASGAGPPFEFRWMAAVPLDDDAGLVGVLTLYRRESGAFDPAELGALLLIRGELAASLRKALAEGFATEMARLAAALLDAVEAPAKQTA